MTSENIDYSEFTEEEMNDTSAGLGYIAAGIATGVAVAFATVKLLEWKDRRKAKKATNDE